MAKLPSRAGGPISKKEARELLDTFRQKVKVKNKATYYTLDVFQRLMNMPGCVGIRIYPGIQNDTFTPILIAVDENGDNIYHDRTKMAALAEDDASASGIEERGGTCPPYCASNDI
jgi:hypothetical protein